MLNINRYVLQELQKNRISKSEAKDLLKQVQAGQVSSLKQSLHPLLHTNTSNLSEQRFTSYFTGKEFFLSDHVIHGKKILPGVAYLEMAHEAALRAAGNEYDSLSIVIRDIVWVNPYLAEQDFSPIHISLSIEEGKNKHNGLGDKADVSFEVYSENVKGKDLQVITHCVGKIEYCGDVDSVNVDIERIKDSNVERRLLANDCYQAFNDIGLCYGPDFRLMGDLITGTIDNQAYVLTLLKLPRESLSNSSGQLYLHPGLMDAALQSSIGLLGSAIEEGAASILQVPFSLEKCEVYSRCDAQMWAWVRKSDGSAVNGSLGKLDIDLIDNSGRVCVALRGYFTRPATKHTVLSNPQRLNPNGLGDANDNLVETSACEATQLFCPKWEALNSPRHDVTNISKNNIIIFCDMNLQSKQPEILNKDKIYHISSDLDDIGERFIDCSIKLVQLVKQFVEIKNERSLFLQVVVKEDINIGTGSLMSGISGFLKSVGLEYPRICGQIFIVDNSIEEKEIYQQVYEGRFFPEINEILYKNGKRMMLNWREAEKVSSVNKAIHWSDGGVYLISGGAGSLGIAFAREIVTRADKPKLFLFGRSTLTANQLEALDDLRTSGAVVEYRQIDITHGQSVVDIVCEIRSKYGRLNGVIHSAGIIKDSLLLKKSYLDIESVLAPKVKGIVYLDEATKDEALDFFVSFSSITGVLGNIGQADYALANGYIDAYSHYRHRLTKINERQGITLSINWPLWSDGGMKIDPSLQELVGETTGLVALPNSVGISMFGQALSCNSAQVLVAQGNIEKFRRTLLVKELPRKSRNSIANTKSDSSYGEAHTGNSTHADPIDSDQNVSDSSLLLGSALKDKASSYFKKLLSSEIALPASRIDVNAPLESYGIDSVMTLKLTSKLEETFGPLSKTLFFEYQTIKELSEYFLEFFHSQMLELLGLESKVTQVPGANTEVVANQDKPLAKSRRSHRRFVTPTVARDSQPVPSGALDIAIVGLSGRYPQARDVNAYWHNLREGKDSITEIPAERWNHSRYFDPTKGKLGKSYSKWGGFIDGVDEFDPLYFNISPAEAEIMDPQERLFLQCAMGTLEDAGYTRHDTQNVGVYVGVMYEEYQLYGAQAQVQGNPFALSGVPSSVANRVSYFCDFRGPSLAVDSMCSSSLSTVHLACQGILQGDCEMALAGGVNVSIHPNKYLMLSQGQFISSKGRCQSFGKEGDGYVPGEGVGAVLLKPLSKAVADRDNVYGVIKGTAINHGGKTNGYSVPNPRAQASVIGSAFASSGIDPRTISYIEAHGTGTSLGDPIEITGLSKAYREYTDEKAFCAIGSAKSNIGHCESAAGIAGITKVLLQLKHRQLAPSLHSEELNPNIDFQQTPFVVQQQLKEWSRPRVSLDGQAEREYPRRAGVSSFGAGGANAHVVIEEYLNDSVESANISFLITSQNPALIVLSAKNETQLVAQVEGLLEALQSSTYAEGDLASIAYTLQIGREAMEERLALSASSLSVLTKKLSDFIDGHEVDELYRGQVKKNKETLGILAQDEDMASIVNTWIEKGKYEKLLEIWVRGLSVDWRGLYGALSPRRLSLPTYPFARQRYWLPSLPSLSSTMPSGILHPLLHENTSNLSVQRFSTCFTGEEFFLSDHRVGGKRVLPAVAYLEMAREALSRSAGAGETGALRLEAISWLRPLIVEPEDPKKGVTVCINLCPNDQGGVDFEIRDDLPSEEGEKAIYSRGKAVFETGAEELIVDLVALQHEITQTCIKKDQCYEKFSEMGIDYGPGHQAIESMYIDGKQVLAKLYLPGFDSDLEQYYMHPGLMDSALQAAMGLLITNPAAENMDWEKPPMPYELQELQLYSPLNQRELWVWVRECTDDSLLKADAAEEKILDIDLCDSEGKIYVTMKGFRVWLPEDYPTTGDVVATHLLAPVWEPINSTAFNGQSSEVEIVENVKKEKVLLIGGTDEDRDTVTQCFGEVSHLENNKTYTEEELGEFLEGREQIDQVVWIAPTVTDLSSCDDAILLAQNEGVIALFRLIKALLSLSYDGRKLSWTVITYQTQAIYPNEKVVPHHASVHGLVGSMAKEYPAWNIQLLDMEVGSGLPLDKIIKLEMLDKNGDSRAYRDGQWYRQMLATVAPKAKSSPYRQGGVYVVIGGAGGIGEAWSEMMIRCHQANVVWIGRREKDVEIEEKLEKLAELGPKPSYIAADAGDYKMLKYAYKKIKEKHGDISGLVHSALVLQDLSLGNMREENFIGALRSKIDVSVQMSQIFNGEPLDFVLFFSSLQSFTKSPGQSNYAAGCAFKDAYAHHLSNYWDCAIKVINWGYWGGVGVVASPEYKNSMEQMGIGSIEIPEAMEALDQLLSGPMDQIGLLKTIRPDIVSTISGDESIEDLSEPFPISIGVDTLCLNQSLEVVGERGSSELAASTEQLQAIESLLRMLMWAQLRNIAATDSRSIPLASLNERVEDRYRLWLEYSLKELVDHASINYTEDNCVMSEGDYTDTEDLWRIWDEKKIVWLENSAISAQVKLVEATLRELPNILIGSRFATDILFPDGSMALVEGVYKGNPMADHFNEILANTLIAYIEKKKIAGYQDGLRVLEVGAGTGGTSALVLERLLPYSEEIEEYCYTDLSRAFLIYGENNYGETHPYLRYQLYDVEKSANDQGIDLGSYDIVIASNVLHATKDIHNTMRNVKSLLKCGGLLLVNEISDSHLLTHLTFGLLDGWWSYKDSASRIPGCPGLYPSQWQRVLSHEGFQSVCFPAMGFHDWGQQIIAAQSNGVIRIKNETTLDRSLAGKKIISKRNKTSLEVKQHLPELIQPGDQLLAENAKLGADSSSKLTLDDRLRVFLRASVANTLKLDEEMIDDDQSFMEYGVDSITGIELVKVINEEFSLSMPTTVLFDYNNIDQLHHYILDEYHQKLTVSITASLTDEPPVISRSASGERIVADIRDYPSNNHHNVVLGNRFKTVERNAGAIIDAADFSNKKNGSFYRVVIAGPGSIEDIQLVESVAPVLAEGEVRIAVRAFSLNFGDLLCVSGLYPTMPPYPFTPGFEVSGLVVELGLGVKSLRLGEEVIASMGEGLGGQSTMVICHEQQILRKPQSLSYEQACALPVVAITMIDAFRKAQLKRGERILIQTAAGGTGLIAVQLAKYYGAEIIATASAQHKLDYLSELGVTHTVNYLERDFEDAVFEITAGKGVDVVINMLPGNAIQKGMNCLSSGGRYIEIAMTALKSAKAIDLSVLNNNQAFHSVDVRKLGFENPGLLVEYGKEMVRLVEDEVISPTISHIFELDNLHRAYSCLNERKNIGKVVVRISQQFAYTESSLSPVANSPVIDTTTAKDPIAIIGISGRFAKSDSVEELWDNLAQGRDLVDEVSRWDLSSYHDNTDFCNHGSFLDDVDKFDPLFFKISGQEATYIDPQQRLFLEESWKALEDAGYAGEAIKGRQCGVYVGCSASDYPKLFEGKVPPQAFWGNANSVLPARIAYCLDLQGPAVAVDTACSSSLVATHLACQSLWCGETDLALAGGVMVQSTPTFFLASNSAGMLSKTGRSRCFDAAADGFVPGEGVGVLLLKRAGQAIEDGDHIYGLIKGSAVNQDGTTNGITSPSAKSQQRLESAVYEKFDIDPGHIQLVEAMAVGSPLGDSIEVEALSRSFKKYTDKKSYCAIGSIKANLGHTATAAGVAGIIKLLMAMKKNKIPPSIHFDRKNENINFEKTPFYVNTDLKDWVDNTDNEGNARPRCAAISAFGFSGTNAHLVIEEAENANRAHELQPSYLITLSARTEGQLRQKARQLLAFIGENKVLDFGNISYTLLVGRQHFSWRLGIVAEDINQLLELLKNWLSNGKNERIYFASIESVKRSQRLALKNDGERCLVACNECKGSEYISSLKTLAELYISGCDLAFEKLFVGKGYSKLPLPTYPFAKESFWVQEKMESEVQGIAPSSREKTGQFDALATLRPIWKEEAISATQSYCDAKNILVVIAGFDKEYTEALTAQLSGKPSECRVLAYPQSKSVVIHEDRFTAAPMFSSSNGSEIVNAIRNAIDEYRVSASLIQLAIPWNTNEDRAILFGYLSTVFASRKLEQDNGFIQIVYLDEDCSAARNIENIVLNRVYPCSRFVKYKDDTRFVGGFDRIASSETEKNINIWREGGVYVVVGGSSAEYRLVAKEVVESLHASTIVFVTDSKSVAGESDQKNRLKAINVSSPGSHVVFRSVDLGSSRAVECLLENTIAEFRHIHGVIYNAYLTDGIFANAEVDSPPDNMVSRQERCLANLDNASASLPLDFFVMRCQATAFSKFVDSDPVREDEILSTFLAYRDYLHQLGLRRGQTLLLRVQDSCKDNSNTSVEKGACDVAIQALLLGLRKGCRQVILASAAEKNILPLPAENAQVDAIQNIPSENALAPETRVTTRHIKPEPGSFVEKSILAKDAQDTGDSTGGNERLEEQLISALRKAVAEKLQLKLEDISVDAGLNDFGFDSITLTEFANEINQCYQLDLSPTIFFSYSTLADLAKYLMLEYSSKFQHIFFDSSVDINSYADRLCDSDDASQRDLIAMLPGSSVVANSVDMSGGNGIDDRVAIIGMSGSFPMARDLDEFWQNLLQGKDCITTVPESRWDWKAIYGDPNTETNKTNIKWGGFMDGVDEMDPLFFGISPREAQSMDPQQRLLITYAWKAIEDAGYAPGSLSGTNTAVLVGTASSGYAALAAQSLGIEGHTATGEVASVGPNRLSYFLNLNGPSEPVETACSSSLVAIHRAVKLLQAGECDVAIVGGVNTMVSPAGHIAFSKAGMLSSDGRCKTFSSNADGYVRGEGVGMLVLKRISDAEHDRDHIYAVIRGSAENHGGKSNSLTAPNPKAQAALLERAYMDAGVDPSSIGYIEAHGTGTELGDPIEIDGLKSGFKVLRRKWRSAEDTKHNDNERYCGLGSVKTNIGHLELAAGIAGVAKVVLQLKNKTLAKSLHCEDVNPYIKLDDSPFYLVDKTIPWEAQVDSCGLPMPRRAGVSSFGFGGVNAHVVLEEYIEAGKISKAISYSESKGFAIILSAKNTDSLNMQVHSLLAALQKYAFTDEDLPGVAYTLQVGRDAMDERLGFVVRSMEDLIIKLKNLDKGESDISVYRGKIRQAREALSVLSDDNELREAVENWVKKGKLEKLLGLWVKGLDFDWTSMYSEIRPLRVSLPSYEFSNKRYWYEDNSESSGVDHVSCLRDNDSQSPTEQLLTNDADRDNNNAITLQHGSWYEQSWDIIEKGTVSLSLSGSYLILSDNSIIANCLINRLRELGKDPVIVPLPVQVEAQPESLSAQDIQVLVSSAISNIGNTSAVLNFWGMSKVGSGSLPFGLEMSLYALQSVIELFKDKPIPCWMLTTRSVSVSTDDFLENPEQAMTWGMGRVFASEHPDFWGGLIDFSFGESNCEQAAMIDVVLSCIHTQRRERYIAIRNEKLYVQRLVRCDIPDTTEQKYCESETILITGGVGSLGLALSQWLVKNGVKNLVLTSRSEVNDRDKRKLINEMERQGACVQVYVADIANRNAMAKVMNAIRSTGRRLNSVFHLAGQLADGSFVDHNRGNFDQVLNSKVAGANVLVELLEHEAIEQLVFFSSLSSVLGSVGQTAYSAANAYMDALSYSLRLKGMNCCSISWGPWSEVGMAVDHIQFMASIGVMGMQTERALKSLPRSLACGLPHIVAADIDWATFGRKIGIDESNKIYGSFFDSINSVDIYENKEMPSVTLSSGNVDVESNDVRGTLERAGASNKKPLLESYLLGVLSQVLDIQKDMIETDADFGSELGLDSIAGMEVLRKIKGDLGINLYPRELFEQPNISDLASYIVDEMSSNFDDANLSLSIIEEESERVSCEPTISLDKELCGARVIRQERREQLQPIAFILSSPRAGSTLLRTMLAGHPKLFSPPELHLLPFDNMRERSEQLDAASFGEGLQRAFMELKDLDADQSKKLCETFVDDGVCVYDIYEKLITANSGRILVDKSPSYAMSREVLVRAEELFYKPKYIHLIRHPYSVIESFVRMRMDKLLGLKNDNPYAAAEEIWRISNGNIKGFFSDVIDTDRQLVVSYESLINEPDLILKEICQFLGVELNSDLANPYLPGRMADGVHPSSIPVGDPNFLSHSRVENHLADAWRYIKLPQQLKDSTVGLAESYLYSISRKEKPKMLSGEPSFTGRESKHEINGASISICEWGDKNNQPLLCLHGYLDQSLIWEYVARELAEKGFWVVAPDLRGHGLSSHLDNERLGDLSLFMADVDGIIENYIKREVVLIGHSVSSIFSSVYASRNRENIRALVLVETVLPKQESLTKKNKQVKPVRLIRQKLLKDIGNAAMRLQVANKGLSNEFALMLAKRVTKPVEGGLTWTWDPLLIQLRRQNGLERVVDQKTYLDLLAKLQTPLLAINGSLSAHRREIDERKISTVLKANIKIVEGRHHVHVDNPSAVAAEIVKFLDGNN